MANIEFKGFKLMYAGGWGVGNVVDALSGTSHDGILYLVRTDADNEDGYLVLNGKAYGSSKEAKTLIKTKIAALDATVSTSGTTYISGEIVETDGKLTSFTINETKLNEKFAEINTAIEEGGTIDTRINKAVNGLDGRLSAEIGINKENISNITADTQNIHTLIAGLDTSVNNITKAGGTIDTKIAALDATVSGTSTNSPITVKVEQVDGKLTGVEVTDTLGTAAKANVLATGSTISGATGVDNNLVSVKQVTDYVKDRVANLTGAMHFEGKKEKVPVDNTGYESGDVILVGTKEYVYDGAKWVELGDEGIYLTIATAEADYVKKTTTIANVNLQGNITKEELLRALNVADGAQVNKLEGVKVNGTDLSIADKKVNITIAEGAANGKIAVNGVDVAVHGLGSAAYTNSDAYDASGTATAEIAKISGTTESTGSTNGIKVTTTQAEGKVTAITVDDSALKTTIDGINTNITNLGNAAVKNVNGKTGNTITLTGADVAVGADVDGTGGTMTANSKVSEVLTDIYSKLNTAKAEAYTGITATDTTVVTKTPNGHSVAVKLKELSPDEKASGLIQLVADEKGIYGKLFFDGEEKPAPLPS